MFIHKPQKLQLPQSNSNSTPLSSDSNYPHYNQTAYRTSSSPLQTPVTVTDSSSYAAVRPPDIPLTGDAEADADILAFLKARQNAIQLGECALCHSLVV